MYKICEHRKAESIPEGRIFSKTWAHGRIRAIAIITAVLVLVLSSPGWLPSAPYALGMSEEEVINRSYAQLTSLRDFKSDLIIEPSNTNENMVPMTLKLLYSREHDLFRVEFADANVLSDMILIFDRKNKTFTMYWPLSNTAVRSGLNESGKLIEESMAGFGGFFEFLVTGLGSDDFDMESIFSSSEPSNDNILFRSLGTVKVDGTLCYLFEGSKKDKPNQPLGRVYISSENWLPIKTEYYDETSNIVLTLKLRNIRLNSGIKLQDLTGLPPGAEIMKF